MDSTWLSGVSFLLKLTLITLRDVFLSSECEGDGCPDELGGGEGFLNGGSICIRPGDGGGSYTGLCGVYPGLCARCDGDGSAVEGGVGD